MVAPVIVVLYDVLEAPKVLTRENNKGNEVEQLDRLMNTTRYAEQIRKAGYQVDDYDLKMMDTNTKEIFVYINVYRNRISFDKDMNINGSAIDQGRDKSSRMATEEEKSKYEKEIKQEINKLLDDVYKVGEK